MTSKSLFQNQNFPRVSWVICAHYPHPNLKNAIQSCLQQTYLDFEVLIIANGPKSNVVESFITQEFGDNSRIRVICTSVQGLIFSLNLGIHHALGEFIARMDFDDVSMPDRLKRQIEFMDINPQVSVLGGAYTLIDKVGNYKTTISNPEKHKKIIKSLYYRNPICHPTTLIRRKSLMEIGGYRGGTHAEDYDLWVRMALKNNQFANLPNSLIGYQVEGGEARAAREAYASQAGSQIRAFCMGNGILWLIAAMITYIKIIFAK